MNECPDRSKLEQFLGEALEPSEFESIEEHASHCGHCCGVLAELVESSMGFQSLSTANGDFGLTDRIAEAIERHVGVPLDAVESRSTSGNQSGTDTLPSADGHIVHEMVGRGGMGTVYRATELGLRRDVAFKVLNRIGDNIEQSRRFEREARITARLDHPNIVPIHHYGQDHGGKNFYTMRLVEGRGLKEIFRKAAKGEDGWNQSRVLAVMVRVCQTIAFAHSRNIIHRDLKPANIMVGELGEVYILDWGLARFIEAELEQDSELTEDEQTSPEFPTPDGSGESQSAGSVAAGAAEAGSDNGVGSHEAPLTEAGAMLGTPAYMPPEQAAGKTELVDELTDIYALGAILYEFFSGHPPYVNPERKLSPLEILQAIGERAPQSLAQSKTRTPPELVAICEKAMARERADRYASGAELAEDLQAFLDQRVVRAYRTGAFTEARKWVSRNKFAAFALMLAILATVSGLIANAAIQARANRDLSAANTKEREARKDAEAQFDLAVAAIENYHSGVAEDFLLAQKEFKELRASLLKSAQEFYTSLVERLNVHEDLLPRQRDSLFMGYVNLAELAERLGNRDEAKEYFDRALAFNEVLLEKDEAAPKLREDRARALLDNARQTFAIGETDKAKAMLDEAESLTHELSQELPDDIEIRLLDGALNSARASFLRAEGKFDESRVCLDNAIECHRKLLEKEPGNDRYKLKLASVLNDLGTLLETRKDFAGSETASRESADLFLEILESRPGDAVALYRLASVYTNLAYLLQRTRRPDAALEAYDKAEPLFRQLLARAPNVGRFRSGLASTMNNLALLHTSEANFERADECHRKMLALKERLVADYPEAMEHRISLGGGYSNFASFLIKQGNSPEAIKVLTQSIATLRKVLDIHPQQVKARMFSRQAYWNRAKAYQQTKEFDKAAADFASARKVNPDPAAAAGLRRLHGLALAKAGKHKETAAIAKEISASAKSDQEFFEIAYLYALAVEIVDRTSDLDDAAKDTLLQAYTKAAVESLRKMFAAGTISKANFSHILRTNQFLQPLHGRPAYDALRKELE